MKRVVEMKTWPTKSHGGVKDHQQKCVVLGMPDQAQAQDEKLTNARL